MQTPSSSTAPGNSNRTFRLFSLRTFGFVMVGLAALVTLIGLFFAEEDWRGKHSWETYRREAEARGVVFDFARFIPPTVPDDQNFAMTPFLAPLLDLNPLPLQPGQTVWRDAAGRDRAENFGTKFKATLDTNPPVSVIGTGHITDFTAVAHSLSKGPLPAGVSPVQAVLDDLKEYQPVLDELETASHRQYSRFNIPYEYDNPAAILLPHLAVLKRCALMLQVQASANLALNRPDTAMQKLNLMFYLTDSTHGEAFLIDYLVRLAMLNCTRQVIWEGLAEGRWSDAQLRELQTQLGRFNLAKDATQAIDSERASFGDKLFDYLRKNQHNVNEVLDQSQPLGNLFTFVPSGWLYLEQTSYQRAFDQRVTPNFDPETGRVYPDRIDKDFEDQNSKDKNIMGHLWRHDFFVRILLPALDKCYLKVATGETGMNETMIACALERYRLANGKLPATLDELVPKFLDHVPLDVCNGQPLIYHPAGDRDFVLYSVGWNGKDDGGITAMKAGKTGGPEPTQGDWVWPQYSEK